MHNSLENEFFVVSDIDIQFFDSIYDTIIEYMNKNNDIIFQKENSGGDTINTGFMLIKNTKQTKEFWINILNDLKSSDENFFINEQALANLKLDQILSDTFNGTIWNWSQGSLNSKIILHHANCVATTQDKILQLEHVKSYING